MKVILLMAITLDGKIAKHTNHAATWTSKADKKIFVEETKRAGAIIMGQTTYDTIGRPLPGRLNIVMNLEPDTSRNIAQELEFTKTQPKELLAELEKRGFKSVIIGGGATINGLFLKLNLIDEIWLTVEPKIFGQGLSLFNGADVDLNLEFIESKQLDENVIHVRYKVIK
ncbi:dihydrofolate reductase family protein [Patescibacteria group bacterium]|nr:dihydrofolate reductase family protein [Patescibacteria group bacterium]MBU1922029.1 dihydrofolate reductase family protein [Patescibacteria group bacterium]